MLAQLSELSAKYRLLENANQFLVETISDISQLLSYTDADDMLDFVVGQIIEKFIPSSTLVFVHPPRKNRVRQYYFKGVERLDGQFEENSVNALIRYFDDFSYDEMNALGHYSFDIIQGELSEHLSEDLLDLNLKHIFPLAGIGGVYGIIGLSDKILGDNYTESDYAYLHRIFSILAITLQNGLHYESSITDPKTGLFTYDYFVHRMESAINAAHRYNRISAMIMIDIDHFKWFNDSYGHLAGDKVLIELARNLRRMVREDDCVCRFGGEEFAILLSECQYESVKDVADRIRREVEKMEVQEGDEILKVTISLGVFIITDIPNLTPTYITERSDRALYHSKENGRNQVTVFRPGLLDKAELSLGPHEPAVEEQD